MRASINRLVGIVAESLPVAEPVYEFGSFQVPGQEAIAELRGYFPGKEYVGTDMREGTGVDMVLDLHRLDLPDTSVGTAIMIDTMEHVEYPRRAMAEVHRVLKPAGMVLMTSVMRFPIHDYPYDYWRFTPEAFRSLLKEFGFVWVDYAGEEDFPHTVIGIGAKSPPPTEAWEPFERRFHRWKSWARAATWPEWLTDRPPGVPGGLPKPIGERFRGWLDEVRARRPPPSPPDL